jgi:hypothetical protein
MVCFSDPVHSPLVRVLSLLAALILTPMAVRAADEVDAGAMSEKEIYERGLIQRAFLELGLTREPQPAGKQVERVEVLRYPIVEQSDPWPNFVNLFHVTTREHIVYQELLFSAGQTYDEALVRESARNLRALPLLFSTVRVVSAKGSSPDAVVVVVITKDLWSIRLNSNGNFGGGQFNWFFLTPSEQNFLGFNQQVSLHYYIDRDVQAIGQVYRVPRLFGSRLRLAESAAVRINHHTGDMEGGWGSLVVQRPLFSLGTQMGFYVQAAFDIGINRFYEGEGARTIAFTDGVRTWTLPEMYQHERFELTAAFLRSFGTAYKTDLSVGYNLRSRTYSLTDGFMLLPSAVIEAYRGLAVPVTDQAGSVFGSIRFYEARFTRLQNVQTLGLTEDFRLGFSVSAEVAFANPGFGFHQHSLRLDLGLAYRWLSAGNLLVVNGSAGARFMPDHDLLGVETDWIDQGYELGIENVSPSLWGAGRFLARVRYVYTQYSRTRSRFSLGGENTLRGFLSGFTSGPRLFNVNLEFRSAPWVIYTMHLGLVLFYDGGDAYGFLAEDDFEYHQGVGVGIRWLFPQFDRGTIRIDVGIPLGRDFHSSVIDWVTIAFLQAF